MTYETKTMKVPAPASAPAPASVANRDQALNDGYEAKEEFFAEQREVVNGLLALDGGTCKMATIANSSTAT